jgi:hypothetical protein
VQFSDINYIHNVIQPSPLFPKVLQQAQRENVIVIPHSPLTLVPDKSLLYFMSLNFPILDISYKWNYYHICPFIYGLSQGSFMLWHVSEYHFFVWMKNSSMGAYPLFFFIC